MANVKPVVQEAFYNDKGKTVIFRLTKQPQPPATSSLESPIALNTKETFTIKKFGGENPKECNEADLIEIIVVEVVNGVQTQHTVYKKELRNHAADDRNA